MSSGLTVRCEDGTDFEGDTIFFVDEGELEVLGTEDATTVYTADVKSIIAGRPAGAD